MFHMTGCVLAITINYLHPTVASHEVAALAKCEAVGLVLTKETALQKLFQTITRVLPFIIITEGKLWSDFNQQVIVTWDVSEGFQVVVGDVVGVDDTAADHVPVLYTWVMTCTVSRDH